MESKFLFDIFGYCCYGEHSIDWNDFCFSLIVHMFVQSDHWLCFLLKSPHSQLNSLQIIISATTGFSPFNKSFDQYFIVALNKK